ncbi:hypothetical protein pipiens_011929 [Culex pipiens pipiens]|uniref:Peptidase S1 domain-containing protein n=1 Tax=Culex pipiens pipiens TaxID=38569 RepID=A0ABD1D500_CULPP
MVLIRWSIVPVLFLFGRNLFAHAETDTRPPSGVDKIVGGVEATRHEFPYQISLQWNFGRNSSRAPVHFCGGSLLNRNWVISAAHCRIRFTRGGWIDAVAGDHDTTKTEGGEQRRRAVKFVIHKDYCGGVCPYDIGLIQVERSYKFNDKIAPIALPKQYEKFSGDCVASGLGVDLDDEQADVSGEKAVLPIVDFKTCYRFWFQEGNPDALSNTCAGPEDGSRSVCSGDSGGPLAKFDEDGSHPVLVGVASWGAVPCGMEEKPAVFTTVSSFIDWIKENMR